MNISPLNFINRPTFKAKHKDVRKADDIMRKTNLAFPMFNPSYAYYFYRSIDENNPNKRYQRRNFEDGICKNFIREVRNPNEIMEEYESPYEVPHAYLLKLLRSKKMGNCKEAAITTLCALYANGYYDSQRVNLSFDYKFIDKITGEKRLAGEADIDHCAVMTDFNNPDRKRLQQLIVIDPWLESAGTIDEMSAKYKMFFDKSINNTIKEIAQKENIDLSKYDVNISPFFTYAGKKTPEQAQRIARYIKHTYPELCMDNIK